MLLFMLTLRSLCHADDSRVTMARLLVVDDSWRILL